MAMASVNRALASIGRNYGVGLLVGLVGVAFLFHNLAGKPIRATLWADNFDPNLIVWTVEWGYHTIFQRLAPLDLWNANSYFPYPKSLAFSDSLLSAQFLYAPLRLIGFGPLIALYGTLAGFCIIGAALTDRRLRDYAFTPGERALILVTAHFALPMTTFLAGHYQLFGMQFVPSFLLALHRLLNEWRGRDLVFVTAVFCIGGGFATYFVPMMGLVIVFAVLIFSIAIFRRRNVFEIFRSLGWKSIALSLVIFALFFVVQLRPYLSLFGTLPPQPMTDTLQYSARPWSILLHPSVNSFWYKPAPVNYGYWERSAFPGFPLLLLAAIGAIVWLRRLPAMSLERGDTPADKPAVPLATYGVAIFLICWVLSWGPYLQLCACNDDKLNLPFLVLAKFIPGVENIRAPGRYAQFYGLPLGLMAVVCVRWAAPHLRLAVSILAAVFAVVVLIDQMPNARTYPFVVGHADFFRAAKPMLEEGKPVIVLPIAGEQHIDTWSNRSRQLVSSTIYWGRLVTGAGSRDTPELNELIGLDTQLRRGIGSMADIAAYGHKVGIDKLVVFPDDYPPEVRAKIVAETEGLNGRMLLKNSEGMILLLAP